MSSIHTTTATAGQQALQASHPAGASATKPSTQASLKDSIKSTWRRQSRSKWTPYHWFYEILGIHPTNLDEEIPVHQKKEKVPHMHERSLHLWVLTHAFIPIFIQHLYVTLTGRNLTSLQAFFFYSAAFKLTAIHELHILRREGHKFGFLDGDAHERDGVPDVGVKKVVYSLVSTSTFRPILTVFLSYRASQAPADMNWLWLPFEAGIYGIVLDFWFYWYHRLMHEVASLWKFHRTHHLTKHPNPLLTLYADTEQEFFDIIGIPLLTYLSLKAMGLPMGFYEWWICHQYVVFAEIAGHSGLRIHTSPPNTLSPLLRWFKCELVIEDHDLHHRKGWKSSGNYGKQTLLWDRIFGTCKDRIECTGDNIDWENTVSLPIF